MMPVSATLLCCHWRHSRCTIILPPCNPVQSCHLIRSGLDCQIQRSAAAWRLRSEQQAVRCGLPVIHPRFANSVTIVLELIFVPVLTAVEGRKRLRIFRKNFVIGTVCPKVLFARSKDACYPSGAPLTGSYSGMQCRGRLSPHCDWPRFVCCKTSQLCLCSICQGESHDPNAIVDFFA